MSRIRISCIRNSKELMLCPIFIATISVEQPPDGLTTRLNSVGFHPRCWVSWKCLRMALSTFTKVGRPTPHSHRRDEPKPCVHQAKKLVTSICLKTGIPRKNTKMCRRSTEFQGELKNILTRLEPVSYEVSFNSIRARGGSDVEQEVKYALSRGRDHARAPFQVDTSNPQCLDCRH